MTSQSSLERREAAAAWHLKSAEGSLSRDEEERLSEWLQDPANHAEFEHMRAVVALVTRDGGEPRMIHLRREARVAMDNARRKRRLRFRTLPLCAAASVLIVCLAGPLLRMGTSPATYRTPIGKPAVIALQDGSQVTLDADSTLTVFFRPDARLLRLEHGRALFEVAKNKSKPFVVTAGKTSVVATGTEFSVELLEKRLQVVLFHGSINLTKSASTDSPNLLGSSGVHIARAGTKMTLVDRQGAIDAAFIDPRHELSWRGGRLTFTGETLTTAIERVERYSGERITARGAAKDLPINGVFNEGDTAGFVDAVRTLYHLDATRDGDTLVLTMPAKTS